MHLPFFVSPKKGSKEMRSRCAGCCATPLGPGHWPGVGRTRPSCGRTQTGCRRLPPSSDPDLGGLEGSRGSLWSGQWYSTDWKNKACMANHCAHFKRFTHRGFSPQMVVMHLFPSEPPSTADRSGVVRGVCLSPAAGRASLRTGHAGRGAQGTRRAVKSGRLSLLPFFGETKKGRCMRGTPRT